MKIILILFFLFFQTYINAQEIDLSLLSNNERISYGGNFDQKILTNGSYSSILGNYIFERGLYYLSLFNEPSHKITSYFNFPKPMISHNGLILGEYIESGNWKILKKGHIGYLLFDSNSDYTYKRELGMLYHIRRLYLFDGNFLLFTPDEWIDFEGSNPRIQSIKSSSFLTEGDTQYTGDFFILNSQPEILPWVEGAEGYGIGEWFEFTTTTHFLPIDLFLVSNGYVDFKRPYLYEKNSRVKTLQIDIPEHDLSFQAELEDTPQLQEIRLPRSIGDGETTVRFTILDVYRGSAWDDTCLSLILPLGDLPE